MLIFRLKDTIKKRLRKECIDIAKFRVILQRLIFYKKIANNINAYRGKLLIENIIHVKYT